MVSFRAASVAEVGVEHNGHRAIENVVARLYVHKHFIEWELEWRHWNGYHVCLDTLIELYLHHSCTLDVLLLGGSSAKLSLIPGLETPSVFGVLLAVLLFTLPQM
jgi:hypothetical protein